MGGGWNYKRFANLNRPKMAEVHPLSADNPKNWNKQYPNCRGRFDDCPTEPDFKSTIEKDPKNPPERCKECWMFKESKFYEKKPYLPSEGVLKLMREAK